MYPKFKIIFIIIFANYIYAECDSYSQFECTNSSECEWTENVDSGYCSDYNYNSALCNSIEQCNWSSYQIDCGTGTGYSDCVSQPGCSYSWLTYQCSGLTTVTDCNGGYYEIDNGYCQEIEMPECSEMNEFECSINDSCEWVENFDMEWCNFGDSGSCNSVPGCNWECDSWYTWLCGCEGQYQVDYSYCTDEIQLSECSEMSQQECSSDNNCEWVLDIQYGNCSEFNQSPSACEATVGCYGAYQYPGWYSGWYCAGGNYQIDISSCEEIQYQMGDINGDNLINILDVIETINLILDDEYDYMVDMDQNSYINILDIIQIINIILNMEN